MTNNFRLYILFFILSSTLFALDAKVNVYVQAHDTVFTSQKVTVAVELLTDAFSITDANINFPRSNAYIVQAPQSASYLRTVDVNGSNWQMVLYEYDVYVLKAGEIDIKEMDISFSVSMGYGQEKKEFTLKSKALSIDVQAPEGVKNNAFILVTDNYDLTHTLKPEKKKLIIGDAVTLEVTQKAKAVPDILLQPIVYKSNAHLQVYDKEPVLRDDLKGTFDVSRSDYFTFVANVEGNVTLETKNIHWWNAKTKKVVFSTIPAFHFEIIADPQLAIDAKKEKEKALLLNVVLVLVVTGFILLLGRKYLAPVFKRYRQRKRVDFSLEERLNP